MLSPSALLLVLAGASAHTTINEATSRSQGAATGAALQEADVAPEAQRVVTIGYQDGAPFGATDAKPSVATVLEDAFPQDQYERRFLRFHRTELPGAIQNGLADIGVITVRATATTQDELPEEALFPTTDVRNVQTLPIHPAGYAVVTRPRELGWSEELSNASLFLIPLGGLLGVFALAACAFLLNFRLPAVTFGRPSTRQGELVIGSFNRVDPQLVALSRTTHWLLQTTRGRVMAALWAVLGMALSLLLIHGAAPIDHGSVAPHDHLLEGPMRAAYPGSRLQELRDEWSPCTRPSDCLTNYRSEKVTAIAGDRDLLCQYAELSQTRLEFQPGIAVPLQYALLLPKPGNIDSPGVEARRAALRAALVEALRRRPLPTSPWSPCGPGSSAN